MGFEASEEFFIVENSLFIEGSRVRLLTQGTGTGRFREVRHTPTATGTGTFGDGAMIAGGPAATAGPGGGALPGSMRQSHAAAQATHTPNANMMPHVGYIYMFICPLGLPPLVGR